MEHSLTFSSLRFTFFVQNRWEHSWRENRRLLVCKEQCLEDVSWARTKMHGNSLLRLCWQAWEWLWCPLDGTRFMPGPLADSCLKHCRSRQKATPSRFVLISYFSRKKWSGNVYQQSWENKEYGQISNSITVLFFIFLLLNQWHCPKPPVLWCLVLFKHVLGYHAKTSLLYLDFEAMPQYQLSQNTYWNLSQAAVTWILSSRCLGSAILSSWEPGRWDGRLRSAPKLDNKQAPSKPHRSQWEGLGGQQWFWLRSRDTRK